MMAVAARLEETTRLSGKARQARRRLFLQASGATAAGAFDVLVHNISASGLLLESPLTLTIGDRIEIDLPEAQATGAQVIWTSGNLFGCEFDAPIASAALSAAQLRAQPERVIEASVPPGESFGLRLQRLRKACGLPLSQVAARLGVSKPTVWAWEQGRARPASGRIEALAAALGVSPAELQPDNDRAALDGVLARSREQIARVAGTTPDRIRIMIEL